MEGTSFGFPVDNLKMESSWEDGAHQEDSEDTLLHSHPPSLGLGIGFRVRGKVVKYTWRGLGLE